MYNAIRMIMHVNNTVRITFFYISATTKFCSAFIIIADNIVSKNSDAGDPI